MCGGANLVRVAADLAFEPTLPACIGLGRDRGTFAQRLDVRVAQVAELHRRFEEKVGVERFVDVTVDLPEVHVLVPGQELEAIAGRESIEVEVVDAPVAGETVVIREKILDGEVGKEPLEVEVPAHGPFP